MLRAAAVSALAAPSPSSPPPRPRRSRRCRPTAARRSRRSRPSSSRAPSRSPTRPTTAAASATSCRPARAASTTAPDLAAFLATGRTVPHCCEQLGMYSDLLYATPGLQAGDISKYFKDSSFGVRAGDVERRYSPRGDVTIVRDKGFGVPHVYGRDRDGAMFGLGYAAAEDRLFFMDALRNAGRGQLSSFAGGANTAQDAEQWEVAPYTEADLERQTKPPPGFPADPRGHDRLRRRQLHRRHQPLHHRGEARPDQDAGRVRGDRAPAGPRAVEARRPGRGGVARRRHLRQGRRRGDRVDADQARPRRALQEAQARREGLPRLPRRRGPRGADHGARAQALPLPGARRASSRAGAARSTAAARCASSRSSRRAPAAPPRRARAPAARGCSTGCSRSRRPPRTRCSSARASRRAASR